jgi:hypothetical protein
MQYCSFKNFNTNYYLGGAVYVISPASYITDTGSALQYNSAYIGGAIFVVNIAGFSLTGSVISNNLGIYGAAIGTGWESLTYD